MEHLEIIEQFTSSNTLTAQEMFLQLSKEQRIVFLSELAEQAEREAGGNTPYYQLLQVCIRLIYS